ncbi:hypothetical protein ISS04_03215 [Candidatus Woesearchaeota archaeon]|nr:hypothetical protein [Candidatus Woesearchaeota archaeon]
MYGILVLGDSISYGRGEFLNLGWAGRLKKDFESKDPYNCLFNLGIPGDTSTTLLNRFEIEISSRIRPIYPGDKFIIMIAVGVNDSRGINSPTNNQTKKEEFKKNITELIKIAKEYTKNVIILGLTPVDETITNPFEDTYFLNDIIHEYNKILEESTKNKAVFIDLFDELIKLDYKELLADGLHPNKEGYEKIYQIIKNSLVL